MEAYGSETGAALLLETAIGAALFFVLIWTIGVAVRHHRTRWTAGSCPCRMPDTLVLRCCILVGRLRGFAARSAFRIWRKGMPPMPFCRELRSARSV